MIKYLREKIISQSIDDQNILSMQKTHSQNTFNDVMSISMNSNLNDNQKRNQVEKLTAAAGGHRLIGSSSPIIIPKKATCSNTSSQSSSSYTSIADQMSSFSETLFQSHRESDDGYTSLPMLPLNCQKLEHSAAHDRILVKNKRRQAIKEKLTTLKETDGNQIDLFVSTPDDEEQEIVESEIETKLPLQPTVELADLDTARSCLRVTVRPRDHSADHILSTPHISSVQRSVSFKRPQEMTETKFIYRSIYKNDEEENKKSIHEHIYDNLDVFKQNKINTKSDRISNDHDSLVNDNVKTREHSASAVARLRPVTMLIPSNNEKQTTNEFEQVFNQLKKRASIKKVQGNEETQPVAEEPVQSPSSVMIEEPPINLVPENELIAPAAISANKVVVTPSVSQSLNRRRTVGGVHLMGNNKVAVEDNKPSPPWIDIAKQKQNKFQSVANDKDPQEEETTLIKPVIASRITENRLEETRPNRKSMYEPIITRRPSPATTQAIERDSIRALKANNPNRINNLIQLFDK